MSGSKGGLAALVEKEIEKKAVYIHCFGHCINLAVKDLFKELKEKNQKSILADMMDNVYVITTLIKNSPGIIIITCVSMVVNA